MKNYFDLIFNFFLKFVSVLATMLFLVACSIRSDLAKVEQQQGQAASLEPATQGVCGFIPDACLAGLLHEIPDSGDQHKWLCKGTHGGDDAACALTIPKPEKNCVQVFYDKTGDSDMLGRSYALMIINLLGHFPKYQQILGPIELYQKGDLERCAASFYVGLVKGNSLPQDFINDYRTATQQIIWMGYNFWQLGKNFENTFGYSTYELTDIDYKNRTPPPDNKPSFFRDIIYKGEIFPKYNVWSFENSEILEAPYEMVRLTGKSSDKAKVLGEAKHSLTGEVIPWALQSKNKFYITEVPLSYFHEADRYFVFADLMFDFLKEQPVHNAKNAFIRIEDVGPMEELKYLKEAVGILKKYNVTPHMNLYPIFADPLYAVSGHEGKPILRMEDAFEFKGAIKKYIQEGAVVIWHGVTHQYSNVKNPYSGASGDDYEFWDYKKLGPIAEDSVNYVLDKMDDGFKSLKLEGIEPKLWVIPHYEASALDNVMFGQMFPWMVSRGVYIDNKITGLPDRIKEKSIYFSLANEEENSKNRRDFFKNLKVEPAAVHTRFGQIFPYELYGDIYGQRLIPEDLGNVEPQLSDQVQFIRTVDTILEDAKRNLVLRDVWASVFYHSFLLDPKENKANKDLTKPKDLERLVKGIQDLGYNFINLEDWVVKNDKPRAKPRIELEEVRKEPVRHAK